jgi:peptidoglycan/xylan/chitin deacetylase (PgdA/CDA1 family)
MALWLRGLAVAVPILGLAGAARGEVGRTEITRWAHGRRGAVSLTYDDGSANQFKVAVPIMDRLGLRATFFVITGEVKGSRYHGTFVGRPPATIVEETATVPTNADNFFERASAIGFLGHQGTLDFHTQAGEVFDEGGDPARAYRILDEAYARVRAGGFPRAAPGASPSDAPAVSWDELRELARRGYEIASHTVTHPRLAVLDEPNLVYELEKSREDVLEHVGFRHTFSVECPYGTENPRVLDYALARYPLARNRMPDPFVDDLDRGNDADPTRSPREYVRWQRGPLTRTPLDLMKSWVDKTAGDDKIWLVLVFHGVDGVGWEPRTGDDLEEYFSYLKAKEDVLWIAPFGDVGRYVREREHATVRSYREADEISVVLRTDLLDARYDLPLTLKTRVPDGWRKVAVRQGGREQTVTVVGEAEGPFVLYDAVPNGEDVRLEPVAAGGPGPGRGGAEKFSFDPGPAVGSRLPAFTARDQSGRTRSFADLRGPNGLVLVFFRSADW